MVVITTLAFKLIKNNEGTGQYWHKCECFKLLQAFLFKDAKIWDVLYKRTLVPQKGLKNFVYPYF